MPLGTNAQCDIVHAGQLHNTGKSFCTAWRHFEAAILRCVQSGKIRELAWDDVGAEFRKQVQY